jgi:hypothetical protein
MQGLDDEKACRDVRVGTYSAPNRAELAHRSRLKASRFAVTWRFVAHQAPPCPTPR